MDATKEIFIKVSKDKLEDRLASLKMGIQFDYTNGQIKAIESILSQGIPIEDDRVYTYDDMMDIAGWMAAADNKMPVHELKEEAEMYIKIKKAALPPNPSKQL